MGRPVYITSPEHGSARLHQMRAVSATAPTPTWSRCGSKLADGCPKIAANKIMDLCGVYYHDRIGQ